MEFWKKYKKIIYIIVPLFIIWGTYLHVKNNFPQVVEKILKIALGPEIKSTSITFPKFGVIDIKNVKLIDKGVTIVDAPEIIITYSKKSLKDFRLKEINVYNPKVIIERKDSNLNIADAFSSGDKKSSSKAGTAVPIDRINIYDGTVIYKDLSYSRKIEKLVEDIEGYVSFDKKNGIKLQFDGDIDKKQYFTYSFNNYKKEYSMNILLKNVNLDDNLLQFAYDDYQLSQVGGIVNLDLTIDTDGLYGDGNFQNGKVRYADLETNVTEINGEVKFLGKKIELKSTYDIFNKLGQFNVNYNEATGVNVDFILNDVSYSELEKYKILGELNLPLEKLFFKKVFINLNYNEKKEFSVNIDFNSKNLNYGKLNLEGIKGKFIFKNDTIYLKNINFTSKYSEGILDYNRNFNINTELKIKKDGMDFELNLPFGNFNGEYSKEKEWVKIFSENKEVLNYDLNKKNLDKLDIDLKNFLGNYNLQVIGNQNNKDINIDELKLYNNNSEIITRGSYNLDGSYDFDYVLKNINSKDLKYINDLKFQGNGFGKIKGEGSKFILENQLEDFNINFQKEGVNNLRTYFLVKNEDKLKVDFQGTMEEVFYDKYSLNGIRFGGKYSDNIVTLLNLNNEILKINGSYNLTNKLITGKYLLNNINNDKFNLKNINFNLKDIEGDIIGNILNPTVTFQLKEGEIKTPNDKIINIKGQGILKNLNLNIEKFYMNENYLSGNYDLKTNKGNIAIQIFEENMASYYSNALLNYRIIGKIDGKIDGTKILSNGLLTVDRGFYKESELPQLKIKLNYKSDNYGDGILNIEYINVLNDKLKKILSGNGSINLKDKKIDFTVPKQILTMDDIRHYIKTEDVKGQIELSSEVSGPFNNIQYKGNIIDGNIKVSDVSFEKLNMDIKGNTKEINLNHFQFNYLGNFLLSKGKYNINSGEYDFSLKSSKIDLGFLEVFLKKYDIEKIDGIANLNLTLSNNENNGYLDINNLNIVSNKYGINLEKLNMKGVLDEKYLYLKEFKGILNTGKFSSVGYLKIPSLMEIETNPDVWRQLDYSLSLNLNQIVYKYENYFSLTISSNLNMKNSKLVGNITIDKGEVKGIPYGNKSLIKIILDFVFDKTRELITKSKDLGKDFEIQSNIETNLDLDIGLSIKDGIDLNIGQMNPIVQDVQGKILGSGFLKGKNNKYLFTGEIDLKNGQFTLGNNQFDVSRALILFSNKEDYIPDVNPTIIFEANTLTDTGRIGVSVLGTLKNLTMNISSNQGVSSSNLSTLITGKNMETETTATAFIMKSIIDSQISDMLLRPISNTVKDVFHISKFRLVSNIVNLNEGNSEQNSERNSGNNFGFGAYLEAENPIYKKKYFWVAKVGVSESTDSLTRSGQTNSSNNNNQATVNDYDFKIERRFPSGWSWGVGVAKLPPDTTITDRKASKLNYYIDFKFEKKYNSLGDIFKRE